MNLVAGLAIMLTYGLSVVGIFSLLRGRSRFAIAPALALAVPLCQSAYSLLIQFSLLTGLSSIISITCGGLFIALTYTAFKERENLWRDGKAMALFMRRRKLFSTVLGTTLIYSLLQILLIPSTNEDGLTYHFTRVFLYLQEGTFFPDSFTLYPQVVFPVGADVLFYPFVALGTLNGAGIFSLSSYCAIGAATYVISRRYCDTSRALLCAFTYLSLTVIVLQAVSVKNDILMAAAFSAVLTLIIGSGKLRRMKLWHKAILVLWLSAFAISTKSTAIALFPGLALLILVEWKLYRPKRLIYLSVRLAKQPTLSLLLVLGILILSQAWLFAVNIKTYGTWSGPPEFAALAQNHDGALGSIANASRYSLQILELGFLAEVFSNFLFNGDSYTTQINQFYESTLKPIAGDSGLSRWPFTILWATHESYSWYGIFGALIFFFCTPLMLFRHPERITHLLPSLGYFVIASAFIAWMPWNGRFFIAFYVGLTPALASCLAHINSLLLLRILGVSLCFSLTATKLFDFKRPLIPIAEEYYSGESRNLAEFFKNAVYNHDNSWQEQHKRPKRHNSNLDKLVADIPSGSSIAIYTSEHRPHYRYYRSRPDLRWIPTNHVRGYGELAANEAVVNLAHTEVQYLLFVGILGLEDHPTSIASSEDGTTHLISTTHNKIMMTVKDSNSIIKSPAFLHPSLKRWRAQLAKQSIE